MDKEYVADFQVETDWLFTEEEMEKEPDWRDKKWNKMSCDFHETIITMDKKEMIIDNHHPKELKDLKGRTVMISAALESGKFKYFFGTIIKGTNSKRGVKATVKYDDYIEPYDVELKYNLWTGLDFWHEPKKDDQWRLLVERTNR